MITLRLLTFWLLLAGTAAMAAPVLKVESSSKSEDTGTMHYVDELRLSVGEGAPLVLVSDPADGVLLPIPGPQYAVGDHDVLLLGWSSTGAGMGSLQAMLFHVDGDKVVHRRTLIRRSDRSHTVWLVRRSGNTVWLGMPDDTGPLHSEVDWYLDLGIPHAEPLNLDAMRKLSFVDVEKDAKDLVFSPPLHLAPPARVAWVVVKPDGFFLRDKPH